MEVANCLYGTDKRFVPLVYFDKKKIGGYEDLYHVNRKGLLKPKLD